MKTIKLIIRENLEKQHYINETIKRISTYETIEEKVDVTMGLIGKLIKEGYNEKEIDNLLSEQEDDLGFLSGFSDFNKSSPNQDDTLGNVASTASGSILTYAREFMFKHFLEFIGVNEYGASILAAAFNRMSAKDLYVAYHSKEGCYANSQAIATGLSSALLTAIFEPTSTVGNYLKQLTVNYMVKNGTEKQMGMYMCDAFFKYKDRNNPKAQAQAQAQAQPNKQLSIDQQNNTVTSTRF